MHSDRYRFLRLIRYKTLSLWDVKRYVQEEISFKNTVKLKDVLYPSFKATSKEEIISKNWQIISKINFAGELFLRDKNETESFKGHLNIVNPDSLIYSKINVRHGCIYYHPNNSTPFAVSGEYPVFKLDSSKIIGDYLVMVIQSNIFKSILNKKTTGISKARIKPAEFLETEIPAPSISAQTELINKYHNRISEAITLEQEASQIEEKINSYILNVLGCNSEQIKKTNERSQIRKSIYLNYVSFKDLSRWDIYNVTAKNISSLFKSIKLSDVLVSQPQYGAGFSSIQYDGKTRYIRITDINEDGSLIDNAVSATGFSERYLLEENDFLIARSGNTVGKSFLYHENLGRAIYAGYLIRFKLNKNIIIPDYLLAYTKCTIYKEWIQSNMRVSAQPNINSQQFMDSPVILPPINLQREIAIHINEQRKRAKQLKHIARQIREKALIEFENEILK